MHRRVIMVLLFVVLVGMMLFIRSNSEQNFFSLVSPSPTVHIAPTLIVGREYDFDLYEQNNSNLNGEVRIKEVNGRLSIAAWSSRELSEALEEKQLTATLYSGSCKSPGKVWAGLNNLVDFSTESFLDMKEEAFVQTLPLALIIKNADAEPDVTLACADISADEFTEAETDDGEFDDD